MSTRHVPHATASALWTAWSSTIRVTVTRPSALVMARHTVVSLMDDVERSASRFRPDTEVVRVNAHAGRMIPVSALTVTLVQASLDAARESGGAVDPTIGSHVLAAGYDTDITRLRGRTILPDVPERPLPQADWASVRVDPTLRLVGVPTGLRLDLGAVAKAWTADEAARRIAQRLDTGVLVEIGGDVAVAGPTERPWRVSVSELRGEPAQVVELHHGGLATSSTRGRHWRTPTGGAHHIIDPRTGLPAVGPWRTATVWGPSAVAANTASTAAIVVGDEAVDHLAEVGHAARLVDHHGRVRRVGEWPADQHRPDPTVAQLRRRDEQAAA